MEYTAETIKEVAKKAIGMLKDAPLSDNGDSHSVMNANGVELTEENFRSWDWGNFTESNDFSNAVENLEYQINQGILELRQKEDLGDFMQKYGVQSINFGSHSLKMGRIDHGNSLQ